MKCGLKGGSVHSGTLLQPLLPTVEEEGGFRPPGTFDRRRRRYFDSSGDNWGTPPQYLKRIKEEFNLGDFDPCPRGQPNFNGLKVDWEDRCFVNPPFSQMPKWAAKAAEEYKKGKFIVLLVPCTRSHTGYFHKHILPNARIRFQRGLLSFVDLGGNRRSGNTPVKAPFGTFLCIFDPVRPPPSTDLNGISQALAEY